MKDNSALLSLLLLSLSLMLMACSLLNSGEKIDELQGTTQALITQVGESKGKAQATPTETVATFEGGEDLEETQPNPQAAGSLELVGQFGGSAAAVAVSGNFAYLGQGPRLVVLDISDTANPLFMNQSEILPGIVLGVEVEDGYVYVTTGYGGLYIYEFNPSGEISRIGSAVPTIPGCGSIEIIGKTVYIACNPGGLFIVDVTHPEDPKILSDGVISGSFISIAVVDDHAYLADINGGGLMVADVSDTANPRQVGTFDVNEIPGEYTKMIEGVDVCGDELCLAVQSYGLAILNLEEPDSPKYVSGDSTYFPSGIVIQKDYAYLLSESEPGVLIYDVSNPLKPQRKGVLPTSIGGLEFAVNEFPERGMFIADGYLYIPDQTYGLTIVDVRDPMSPQLTGRYMTPLPDWLTDITVRDDYAFVVSRSGGFRMVDVSNPLNPREVFYDDERKNLYLQYPTAIEIVDDYAVIADANYPIHVIALGEPDKMAEVGALFDKAASDGAHDMVIAGDYAYLSGWGEKDAFYPGEGIWVVDISKPEMLTPAGFVDLPNGKWSLSISGSTLYALDGEIDPDQSEPLSLRILDISNSANPVLINSIQISELQMMNPSDIDVTDDVMYIGTAMMGLKRFDITAPQHPVELPVDQTLFPYVYQVHAEPPYLVINGNQVMDISTSGSPEFVGYAREALEAWVCDIEGDLLYIATKMNGVYIYRIK